MRNWGVFSLLLLLPRVNSQKVPCSALPVLNDGIPLNDVNGLWYILEVWDPQRVRTPLTCMHINLTTIVPVQDGKNGTLHVAISGQNDSLILDAIISSENSALWVPPDELEMISGVAFLSDDKELMAVAICRTDTGEIETDIFGRSYNVNETIVSQVRSVLLSKGLQNKSRRKTNWTKCKSLLV